MVNRGISIQAAGLSDKGLVREQNEDRFLIDQSIGCYLIADGIGGHQAGEVASRIASEVAANRIARLGTKTKTNPDQALRSAIMAAHQAVRKESYKSFSLQGMGSTLVLAWLPGQGSELWLGHVGDSRAYLMRGVDFIRLTEDHTIYNQAMRAGLLGSDQQTHPPRSLLSQSLGASDVIAPDTTHIELQDDDRLLLCSDGLTDMLSDSQISALFKTGSDLNTTCQRLIGSALDQGGRDNITVIVIQVRSNDK